MIRELRGIAAADWQGGLIDLNWGSGWYKTWTLDSWTGLWTGPWTENLHYAIHMYHYLKIISSIFGESLFRDHVACFLVANRSSSQLALK